MLCTTRARSERESDGGGKSARHVQRTLVAHELISITKGHSASTETGMARLTLSDSDKQARDWFVETTKALGCKVTVDAMGNIFAVRPGRRDGPATFAGSHLDTQPTGGRYDGILGVLAGVEMLNVLRDNQVETEFPVGVVNWTKYVTPFFPYSTVPDRGGILQ